MSAHRYGCHNSPRPAAEGSYPAQDGWDYDPPLAGWPSRMPIIVQVPFRMSTACQYDKAATDPSCSGCAHGRRP